jgi:hypothetical protein
MRRLLLVATIASISGTVGAQQQVRRQLISAPAELDCGQLGVTKERRPVFVGNKDGVRLGISTRKPVVSPGEPVIVDFWVDNRSDSPFMSGGRCPPYQLYVDVFDQSGNRLIGLGEQARLDAERNGRTTVTTCASTDLLMQIPAHTCRKTADTHEDDLTRDYKLAPGVYYVFPMRGTDPALFKQGLMITVREP